MRSGHNAAQRLFQRLGERLAYRFRRTWTRQHPTDGVWVLDMPHVGHQELPVAALEVVVSESGKSLRGSSATLELVSPALGILLVQEQEIRRGLIRSGAAGEVATAHVRRLVAATANDVARSRQRIAVWTFEQLEHRVRIATASAAA